MPDPSNYDASFLQKRVSSGPDKGRAAYADGLMQRAQAGDQAAVSELAWRSGAAPDPNPNDKEGAWATADARNYGKLLLSQAAPGYTPSYDKAHDGGGLLSGVGGVLKKLAPFAGLIPGVGIPLGAALAAGGSALGGAMQGDDFNLGKTLLAGGAGAAGSALGGVKGISKLAGLGGGGGSPTAALGSQGIMGAGGGVQSAVQGAGGGGGILGKLGGVFKGADGRIDPTKVLGAGAAVGGFIDARKQQGQANDFNNARLAQLNRMSGQAEQDYAARAPIRESAYSRLAKLGTAPAGSSIYGRAA